MFFGTCPPRINPALGLAAVYYHKFRTIINFSTITDKEMHIIEDGCGEPARNVSHGESLVNLHLLFLNFYWVKFLK